MFDHIDSRSPTPLYEQIAARIRLAIASGDLRPGDGLPSVRQLAGQLRINPATVVQAYRALAGEGFVDMRQGAGTFVHAVPHERRARERADEARRLVHDMMREAARRGVTADDLRHAIDRELNGHAELAATHATNGRGS